VLQGPGENAGIYALNDNWGLAFKMESHNHPSYIEPYQGAATGVGGILRDIFCMGARPVASLNCLRFGSGEWNATLFKRVVEGIADYGNSVGVPTVCGDTQFHQLYSRNILVNAFTAGIVHRDRIFRGVLEEKVDSEVHEPVTKPSSDIRAAAQTEDASQTSTCYIGAQLDDGLKSVLFPTDGNMLVYFGSATGRDGVHGATMSSAEFSHGTEALKPTVQVGDPFAEKMILEATMALIDSGAMIGLQDMGAAGLTSSSAEMAGRSGCGVAIDLSAVPLRVASGSLAAWEILLSESQERMLCAVTPKNLERVLGILRTFDLPHSVIGRVNDTGRFVCVYDGTVCTDLAVDLLTDGAPVYELPLTDRKDYLDRWQRYTNDTPGSESNTERSATKLALNIGLEPYLRNSAENLHHVLASGKAGLEPTGHGTGSGTGTGSATGTGLLGHLATAYASTIKATLLLPSFCGREPLYRHYCATVGGQTVLADGALFTGAAAVVRLPDETQNSDGEREDKGTPGIALAGGCWERWVMIDPYHGSAHSTAAVARKLIAVGAKPRAMTDCLNFGSPRDPDVMRQFSDSVDGINLVAKGLKIPVVSGNVSLNNQTDGRPIPPTPMIGIAGDHPDVSTACMAYVSTAPRLRKQLSQGALSDNPIRLYAVVPSELSLHVSYSMSEPALIWGGENYGPVPAFDVALEGALWNAVESIQQAVAAAAPTDSSVQGKSATKQPPASTLLLCRPIGRGGLYLTALRTALQSWANFNPSDELLALTADGALGEGQAGFLLGLCGPKNHKEELQSLIGSKHPLRLVDVGTLVCMPTNDSTPLDLGCGIRICPSEYHNQFDSFFEREPNPSGSEE
jgi:phosphoribosylformylglycinamidine synthase